MPAAAERAGLSYATVQRAEAAKGIPATKATNLFAIERALTDAGIVFLEPGGERAGGYGVRLRLS